MLSSLCPIKFDCSKFEFKKALIFTANVQVDCKPDKMDVILERCAADESTITVGHTLLNKDSDNLCSTDNATTDETHHTFSIQFDKCNTYSQVL